MKKFLLVLVAAALTAACGGGAASTPVSWSTPPGPVTKYKNTLSGLNASAQVDLIQNVIDFAPGAASVVHIHASPNLATVLQGSITVKLQAGDKSAATGAMLVEPVNVPLQAVNSGTGEAKIGRAHV